MNRGRILVITLVAACGGSPTVPASGPATVSAESPATAPAPVTSSVPVSPVLAAPEPPTVTAVPPPPYTGIPCFPDRTTPITGQEAIDGLKKYTMMYGNETDVGAWGNCTITDGKVVEPGGRQVAEISCGISFLVPGFVDSNGLTLGVRGKDVRAKVRKGGGLYCTSNGADEARCTLTSKSEGDYEGNTYMVEGELPDDVLLDKKAWAWFAERTVIAILETINCH